MGEELVEVEVKAEQWIDLLKVDAIVGEQHIVPSTQSKGEVQV